MQGWRSACRRPKQRVCQCTLWLYLLAVDAAHRTKTLEVIAVDRIVSKPGIDNCCHPFTRTIWWVTLDEHRLERSRTKVRLVITEVDGHVYLASPPVIDDYVADH